MKAEDIKVGLKVTTHLNEIGVVHKFDNNAPWANMVKVKIMRASVFHKKGEIDEFKPESLMLRVSDILVRPDDHAIFLENPDGSYSHENGTMNYRYDKTLLQSLGFKAIPETDVELIKSVRTNQKVYSQYLQWYTRPDGHGGIKGGTFDEFLKLNV